MSMRVAVGGPIMFCVKVGYELFSYMNCMNCN